METGRSPHEAQPRHIPKEYASIPPFIIRSIHRLRDCYIASEKWGFWLDTVFKRLVPASPQQVNPNGFPIATQWCYSWPNRPFPDGGSYNVRFPDTVIFICQQSWSGSSMNDVKMAQSVMEVGSPLWWQMWPGVTLIHEVMHASSRQESEYKKEVSTRRETRLTKSTASH